MRLACIGWGSLLWRPESLPLGGAWRADGPVLPIEFARISPDGRLTLIIHPGAAPVTTYWAALAVPDLASAVRVFAARERCEPRYIGRWSAAEAVSEVAPLALDVVPGWARAQELDGVVWTDLPATFAARTGRPLSPEAAVAYLSGLEGELRARSETYLRRAPAQTRTALRAHVERVLGWTPLPG